MNLYNKIRPKKFKDMVGQEIITKNLLAQSKINTWFQVFIFAGMYGCGKTTAARITAMAINCQNKAEGEPCGTCPSCRAIMSGSCPDIMEIDAATNTGVDNIRALQETITYLPMMIKKKIYIIDEVHMLSTGAFNALLKTLEEPPEHAAFILCTTDAEKIPATIRSRAAEYTFGRIDDNTIVSYLKETALSAPEGALKLIAKRADGSMRNALMLLEMCERGKEKITEKDVAEVLGMSDEKIIYDILFFVINKNIPEIIKLAEKLSAIGKNFYILSGELLSAVTEVIIYKNKGKQDLAASTMESLKKFDGCSMAKVIMLSKIIMKLREEIRSDASYNNFLLSIINAADSLSPDNYIPAAPERTVEEKETAEIPQNEIFAGDEENGSAEEECAAEAMPAEETDAEDEDFDPFADFFSTVSQEQEQNDFMAVGEEETPFDTEPETVSTGVVEPEPEEMQTEQDEAKASEPEAEKGGFPSFLSEKDIKKYPAALEAAKALKAVLEKDNLFKDSLEGFKAEASEKGLLLYSKDILSVQSVLVKIAKHNIKNVQVTIR